MENNYIVDLNYFNYIVYFASITLIIISEIHDKYLLFAGILGQLILNYGIYKKANHIIELAHIVFILFIIFGSFYFKNIYNILFLIILLSLLFITRYIYGNKCLFHLNSENYRYEFIEKYFDFDWINILKMIFIYLIYRLWNH